MIGSTLFIRVREELGATYGFHGSASSLPAGVGVLSAQGSVEKARFGKALGVIKDVLDKTSTFDDQVFGKARWQMARQATLRGSTSSSMTRTVLRELMLGRNVSSADYAIQTFAEVSKDDVLEAWSACQKSSVFTFVGDKDTIDSAVKAVGW
jgi:predicted Zn-dependent peptidase